MSELAIVKAEPLEPAKLSVKDIETLVAVGAIPKDTPPDVIEFFSRNCAESRLSPFRRQIHLIKRWSKDGDRYTVQTGIDGYRARADRTGLYAGNDDYKFDEGISEYEMLKAGRKQPTTSTVTVYKAVAGTRCPFSATARWEEYFPGEKQGFMWLKMPFLMLGKCAEALALRKAFPDELSGIYTDEEMAQADAKPKREPLREPAASQAPPKRVYEVKATGTEKQPDWEAYKRIFLQRMAEERLEVWAWDYMTSNGWITQDQRLEDYPAEKTPGNKKDFDRLRSELLMLASGPIPEELQAAYDDAHACDQLPGAEVPAKPISSAADSATAQQAAAFVPNLGGAAEEPWFNVVIPVPRKGQKRADYMRNPDTIGSLYEAMHDDEELRKRFWWLVKHWKVQTEWEDSSGKKHLRDDRDLLVDEKCRRALDAFADWHENKIGDIAP